MSKLKLALLGCGDVAQRDYLPEFHRLNDLAEIVAVCGTHETRARTVAAQYNIPHWYTDYRHMLAETDAVAIINLTPIQRHAETNLAAINAGKHLYSEKPLASTVAEAKAIRDTARRHNLKPVCAPCVRLFPQVRHAQQLITGGEIGEIYSARGHGHLGVPPWHGYMSDPSPFFARGGGPALDMGVYPLHTLTTLLGPVQRVTAIVSKVLDSFIVPDGPAAGKRVPVEADDNWQMILDFGNSRLATLAANNVVVSTRSPGVEIHGLSGTIALDPIDVASPIEILRNGSGWQTITLPTTGRAAGPDHHLGVEQLVHAILNDQESVLSADHAIHVLDIIETAARSSASGQILPVTSTFS